MLHVYVHVSLRGLAFLGVEWSEHGAPSRHLNSQAQQILNFRH